MLFALLGCFAPLWFEIALVALGMRVGWRLHLLTALMCAAFFQLLIALGYVNTSRVLGLFWLDLASWAAPWAIQLLFLLLYLPRTMSATKPNLRPWQISIVELLVAMALVGVALSLPRTFGFLTCFGGLFLLLLYVQRHGLKVLGWGGGLILLAVVVISTALRKHWIDAPFTAAWIIVYWSTVGGLVGILQRLVTKSIHSRSIEPEPQRQSV